MTRLLPSRSLSLALTLTLVACGGGSDGDAGMDADHPDTEASVPVPVPDATPDSAPSCDGGCELGFQCCVGDDGVATCTNLNHDPDNCGVCGRQCADGFGDRCELGECACGPVLLGCGGERRSLCCPPRAEGEPHYCANLEEDGDDCGACGDGCAVEAADRCAAGRCVCGEGRSPCAGTPEDTCCSGTFGGTECVDLESDPRHCGGCDVICLGSERCRDGVCTVGTDACTESCTSGHVCCFGECCPRARCDMGFCGRDAGMGD